MAFNCMSLNEEEILKRKILRAQNALASLKRKLKDVS